jgi:putative redox protein
MHARIKWSGNMAFTGETGSGHSIVIDGPAEIGGENKGPRPMELMLLSVGACSSVDVMMILKKARQTVEDCQLEVTSERADTDPKVFTKIHLQFIVTGKDLSENHVRRAVELSAEKYCSASIMLAKGGCEVTHGYEVRQSS